MTKTALLLFTLVVAVALPAYGATIYKWTDKDGQIHYSRTPPPRSMTDAKVEHQDADSVPGAEKAPGFKQAPETTEPGAEEKRRLQLCQAAQKRLREMRRSDKVLENGHEIEITADELLRRLDELNETVKENCPPYTPQPAQPVTIPPASKVIIQKSVPKMVPQPQLPLEKRPEQKMSPPPQSIQ